MAAAPGLAKPGPGTLRVLARAACDLSGRATGNAARPPHDPPYRRGDRRLMPGPPADPRMSVVLATDTYATIRPVIERLRQQTIAADLEIVLVTTSAEALGKGMEELREFAGVQL